MIPTLKSLQLICRLGRAFSGIPFEWSDLFQRIYLTRSRPRLYRWYCAMFIMGVNTAFVTFRSFQASCCMKRVTYGQWVITIFAAVSAMTCTLVNINNFLHRHEIIAVINQIVRIKGKQETWLIANRTNSAALINGLLISGSISELSQIGHLNSHIYFKQIPSTLFYFFFTYGYLQFFSSIVNVTTPKYFHSLVDLEGIAKWKLIPIGFFDMCLIVSGASTLSFGIVFYLTYVLSTKGCLMLLRYACLKYTQIADL